MAQPRQLTETTPLITSNVETDTALLIDVDEQPDQTAQLSHRASTHPEFNFMGMPEDIIKRIIGECSGQDKPSSTFTTLARLSQVNKQMNKLVKETDRGKIAERANDIAPSSLIQSCLPRAEITTVQLCMYTTLVMFMGVSAITYFLLRETGIFGKGDGEAIVGGILTAAIVAVAPALVGGMAIGCTFSLFTRSAQRRLEEAQKLRDTIQNRNDVPTQPNV